MFISMENAFYIYLICNTIGFILILLYRIKHQDTSSCPICYVFYYLSLILSSLMIIYRDFFGSFLSIVVANTLSIVSLTALCKGIMKTVKLPFKKLIPLVLILFVFLSFLTFTYIYPSILIRIIILNLIHICFISYIILFLQKSKLKFSLTDEFMSITLIFYILVSLSRIIFNLIFIDTNNEFLNFTLDPLFILLIGLVNLLLLSGILSLYNNDYVSKYIESERKLTSLVSNLPGFAYRCYNDNEWTMLFLSKQFEKITGYNIKNVLNNKMLSYNDLIKFEFRKNIRESWNKSIDSKTPFIAEYMITTNNGSSIWVWEQGIPIYEADGSCKYLEGFIMDITKRKKMEENLKYLSYNDTLTDLHNRRFLNKQIKEIEKKENYPITVIMGDINGLKFINDSFGHHYGDNVLKYVGKKIKECINHDNNISRISGDEFIVLLKKSDEKEAEVLITNIQQKIEKDNPFDFSVSISLGYCTVYDSKTSLIEAQSKAEDSMYIQKTYAKPSNQRKAIDAVLKTLYEKDPLSEQHSQNVADYAKKFAKVLKLSQQKIQMVETAALLHDVGKIIIDKKILESKNRLTKEEYMEIKKHPEIGYRILSSVPELSKISEIILYHHERIDGKGYPRGIKEKDIPYMSKLISICDAFDAMVNVRLYRKPLTLEMALEEIKNNSGTQFDQKLADVFIKNIHDIYK